MTSTLVIGMPLSDKQTVVLIVEDEALLRMDAMEMLEEAGYQVLEAADADEAITILEARLDINVVFTDIDMPGSMDGIKLARAVRGRWPPIKIIATSGYAHPHRNDLPQGSRYIPKPYNFGEVSQTISELMNG
jgi:CheY-like chemotaxis protein